MAGSVAVKEMNEEKWNKINRNINVTNIETLDYPPIYHLNHLPVVKINCVSAGHLVPMGSRSKDWSMNNTSWHRGMVRE